MANPPHVPAALVREPYIVDARTGSAPNHDGTSRGGGNRQVVSLINDNATGVTSFVEPEAEEAEE